MAQCQVCDTHVAFGRNIRHQASGGWFRRAPKTNRTFKPNVQTATVTIQGQQVQLKLCTKCLRTMYKSR